jgi:general secretion pathway protein H
MVRAGFSLVELMVVLVIIGIMGTAVLLTSNLGGDPLYREAETFGARLKRTHEEALLTNRTVRIEVGPSGYGFKVLRRGVWQPMDKPFEPVRWNEDTTVELKPITAAGSIVFDSSGMVTPVSLTLRRDRASEIIKIDAGGQVRFDDAD